MGEVTAVGELEAQDGVARGGDRGEDRRVRARTGVRLHVGVLGAEQALGPVDRQLLGDVDVLAAAVVAAPGVALGVLVGEHAADRLQDGAGNEVLGRDHLEVVALAAQLELQHLGDLRVDLGERGGERRRKCVGQNRLLL